MTLSEHRDLRGGRPVWTGDRKDIPPSDPLPARCDIAVIGAGIMGATIAERLSADGHQVLLVDRRPPAHGSTAASTAEVMWAMDVPLQELARSIGEDEAIRRWRRVHRAVQTYAERIDALGIDCGRIDRPTVYLAGKTLDADGLREEAALHRKAQLPTDFLDAPATAERFGIAPRAALVSTGGFEVDPVRLTLGLLEKARSRSAKAAFPRDVVGLSPGDEGVVLTFDDGATVAAGKVVFAGGYERAPLLLPPQFSLLSTFLMATVPGAAPLWKEGAMIWEASDPYLYLRACSEGRVIAGGEDEDVIDSLSRDGMLPAKAAAVAAKSAAVLGLDAPLEEDRRWSATFGSSPDGLPAIGLAANMDHVWLTAGFGGNGIAFAALASEIVSAALQGERDPDAACFDPYRFS
ncbi:FAD-binding oxidoreductase [Novosphingobium sp. AP12]|uniref:NAD(P)/FAD-dependent oxidoreductase n=1 Tax=Novosphingobium sp. AP12 TaxID=1144305 RepID=UPI000271D877|nr:FAD-dependent oxidoreductase [Novosphingobium sp. AP12]EJL33535.1 glycine/D-amino acid oxidase, deaminating [Novosphingobium sp. AP12]